MSEETLSKKPEMSPEKLALLVKRMQQKKKAAAAGEPQQQRCIPRRQGTEPPPLSYSQLRLWLLDRIEPGGAAFNMASPAGMRGPLDTPALARALDEIVRRHEALRTTFASGEAEPVQIIAPAAPRALPVADLSALPGDLRQPEADRLMVEDAYRPFDLETGPLLRVLLVRLAADDHVFLLNMHHIVSDGWSFGVFFRELSALYGAFATGQPSPLEELPIQYADFAVWQREWLQGPILQEQISWWRERLAGAPPALELPTDRPRPPVQTHRGALLPYRFSADLSDRLRALARGEGLSLFMLLLAGFQLVLARLAGQDDVVVGSPSAGRQRIQTEGLIGFFLNTLVLRTDLSGSPSFRALLGRVRESVLGAYGHQELPFEKLLEEVQPERQLSRSPIFQVLYNMISLSDMELQMAGLEVRGLRGPDPESKFDLTIYAVDEPELVFNLVYNADLFDEERMAETLRQIEHVLRQGLEDPERAASALSLVTPEAAALLPDPRQPLGAEWRGAVHHALSRHATETPERMAVSDAQGEVWSYGELDARANQLARFLQVEGIAAGDVVAVWAHRSASLVWALMGTFKAGAAFLILDPAYPASRLVELLRIARPAGWLAVEGAPPPPPEVAEAAGTTCRCRLELPARSAAAALGFLANLPDTDPGVPLGPDDAACLTFTSGSTGVPKAVVGRHGPLTHFYPWIGERFGLGADDRFGMLSALSHDPLQRDAFTPLFFGARLVIPDPEGIDTPGYLASWARREKVGVLHLTPAMMELVLESADNGPEPVRDLPALRRAFVVGDLLKKAEVWKLQRLAPALACVNLYGSTETQRSVSFFEIPRPDDPAAARLGREVLPLGRGMQGVQALVLNPAGELAGIGEQGEIHMRSHHLARGYLGDEAATAAKFLPNRFAPEQGDRLYRTGDLGRYLPDGGVELAGRADFQVKIRGFRIELGEIEAALSRFPGVRECVVVVREDRPGDRRLVGYWVPAAEAAEPAPAREIRSFLAETLPDYMVPSALVPLAELPLTRTGKVDRRALPAPEALGPAETRERVAPRNRTEEILASVWGDVLRREEVDVHENFFELGGDSIRAIQVVARSRKQGVLLTPRQIFQHQTLAELAAVAEVEAEKLSPEAPLPWTPAQRLRLAAGISRRETAWVDLPAGTSPETVERALTALAERHDALRLRFADGTQKVLPAEAFRLAGSAEGLDGPALLASLTPEGRLLLAAHPLAVDERSWSLLLEDLAAALEQAASGRPIELPAGTSFARWARALASTEAGSAPAPQGSSEIRPEIRTISVRMGADETRSLLGAALSAYSNTVQEVLLASVAEALAGGLGLPAVTVEVDGIRREVEGLDGTRTVGCLALPLPVLLTGKPEPGENLRETKERLRQLVAKGPEAPEGLRAPEASFSWTAREAAPLPLRRARFGVECRIEEGRLRADWTGSERSLDVIAGRFLDVLRQLIRHGQSTEAGGFTPSDFPVSGLNQADLDDVLAELGQSFGDEDFR